MKNQIIGIALVSAFTFTAEASTVLCTTNTTNDLRAASTSISISDVQNQLSASLVTQGGMAHFVTAPKVFAVEATRVGPEVVIYTNTTEGFKLSVVYQPFAGQIHGTFETTVAGKTFAKPVICKTTPE